MSSDLALAIRQKQEELAALKKRASELEIELKEAKHLLAGRSVDQRLKGRRLPFKRPIRGGSSVDFAKRVLLEAGRPLPIDQLIKRIHVLSGSPVRKATLVSNLSRYVQARDTFVRSAESTYGLINAVSTNDQSAILEDGAGPMEKERETGEVGRTDAQGLRG
jgi:hypothetical protein